MFRKLNKQISTIEVVLDAVLQVLVSKKLVTRKEIQEKILDNAKGE